MKKCSRCKKLKSLTGFHSKNTAPDGLQSTCKDCRKTYIRSHYLRNKSYYLNKANIAKLKAKIRNRNFILKFLEKHPCVDCGETEIILLDFDHVTGQKSFNISRMVSCGYSLKNIKAEMQKCIIRCVSCHRRKTAKQFSWHSYSDG